MAQLGKNLPTRINVYIQGLSCGSAGKESAYNAGDLGLIPGLGRSPGEGKGYSLQYSGLEHSMDRIVWGRKESDVAFTSLSHIYTLPCVT